MLESFISNSRKSVITILIIDDSRSDRTLYRTWLEKESGGKFKTVEAGDGLEGYKAFIKHAPDCIILDFMMPGKDGLELLKDIRNTHGVIPPIIFVTSMGNKTIEEDAIALGASAYIDKNTLTQEGLYDAIKKAIS